MRRTTFLSLMFVLLLSWGAPALFAQASTGTISGTVADATGGVLPGVEITITRVDTGQTRVAITGDEGLYNAPQLAVGDYEVRAELAGFQTSVRRGIRLLVGQEAVVDFTMQIGEITEEVVVTGEAPLVNTTTATLGEVIEEIQVHDLPLNSRNLSQLSMLTPGVTRLYTAISGGVIQGSSSVRVTVGGARTYQTGYLLDGTDVTDSSRGLSPGGAAGALFGVETVKEFQVITNNYSAEYSRFSGGIMSMVTKSGTNEYHGSLFWFHRNDNLDATNFFGNKFGLEKPEFRRHQFGATVGGPIVQKKTFFFFSYEGFREGRGLSLIGLVPSRDAKQGLFATDRDGTCGSLSSIGGALNAAGDKCQVPLHPDIGPFLALYPDPNGRVRGSTGDLVANKTEPTEEDFFTGRVDHTFSDSDSFFGRFSIQDGDKELAQDGQRSFLPSAVTTVSNTNVYTTLEWKHIFSPNTINTARFGGQRNSWDEDCTFGGPLDLGFFPERCMGFVRPGNGVMHAGNWVVGQNVSNQFSYGDDLFLTRGRHDMKMGVLFTRHQTNDFTFASGDGRFQFSSVANFVTGTPFQWDGKIPTDRPIRGTRQWVFGFYFQDDFKFRPNLTLNLGLRYEPSQSPTEVNGLLGNLRDPLNDTEPFVGEPYFKTPSKKNFAPRIGLAWDPFGDGKTSIRAGYGIFHETILPFHYSNQIRRSPPFAQQPIIRNRASLAAQFPRPPPGGTGRRPRAFGFQLGGIRALSALHAAVEPVAAARVLRRHHLDGGLCGLQGNPPAGAAEPERCGAGDSARRPQVVPPGLACSKSELSRYRELGVLFRLPLSRASAGWAQAI
ncbi:TonB-dependent receptor [Acidobacteria bacterium AH-259-D05]|nr:TonB-dependent receptor [Acidobacteria bacterium AH-259-D05]